MATTKEERIARIVQSRFATLAGNQREIFDEVEVFHQMWRAMMTEGEAFPWDYQLVDPVVFYLLRGMLARLNPEHMKVNLEARNKKTQPHRKVNQAVINWELSEMNKTLVFYRFLFRGLLAGRAYLSTGWRFEPAVEVMAGEGGGRKVIMRDVINRADAKNVRFQDVFVPNRNLPEIDDQPYIVERVTMRYGDMLDDNETAGREIWKKKYLDKIRKGSHFTTKIDYGVDLPDSDERVGDHSKEELFIRSQYITLLKMQTLEGDVIWTPEKEDWVLNTEEGNPYWHGHYPYLSWTPFPEDDEFFSMGIVQPIADLQIAISSTLNQFLTNARKAGNPMWIAGSAAAQTPDWQFVNRPDGIIRVAGDINQIRQIETRDTGRTVLEMRRELQTTLERAVSMSSLYLSGVGGGSSPQINRTATGARVIDANIDINLQLLVALFGAQALSKLGEHFLELNAQFLTDEQEIKITGEGGNIEYIRVHPEEITANFDVQANPDTITKITPIVKQASLMNLKALADKETQVKLDKRPIWKALVNAFPELDNIGDILVDVEQTGKEHLDKILGGGQPEVSLDDDHRGLLTFVQKHLLEAANQYDNETLARFLAYVDELRNYLQAANPSLFAPPPQPQMMPTDENALMESMIGGLSPEENPTQGLLEGLTGDQINQL